MKTQVIVLTTIVVVCGFQSSGFGQCNEHDYSWAGASGNWSTPDNWRHEEWDPNLEQCVGVEGVPGLGDTAHVQNGSTVTISSGANVESAFVKYSSNLSLVGGGALAITDGLHVDWNGFFDLSGGQTSARYENVGSYGIGTFRQTGGSHTVINGVFLGNNAGGEGTYIQSGGTNTVIGQNTGCLTLGGQAGSKGRYELSGDGILQTGVIVGLWGEGTFIQTGGTNTLKGAEHFCLVVGYKAGSVGRYELRNGTVVANYFFVGCSGKGTFDQSGGNVTINEGLFVGLNPTEDGSSGNGTYELHGATINIGERLSVGEEGTGSFIMDGGIINATTADAEIEVIGDTGSLTGPGTFNIEVSYESEEIYGTDGDECVEVVFGASCLSEGGAFSVDQLTPAEFAGGQACCLLPSSIFNVTFTGQYCDEFEIAVPYDESEVAALGGNETWLTILRETGPETYERLEHVEVDTVDDIVYAQAAGFGKFALASCFVDVKRRWQGAGWGLLGEERCEDEIPNKALKNANSRKAWCITDSSCPYPPNNNQCTIESKGCVLTSAAMIINSMLGETLTPKKLNEYVLEPSLVPVVFNNRRSCGTGDLNCRIKTNDIYWPYVAELMSKLDSRPYIAERIKPVTKEQIAELICGLSIPVAVRVLGHTVVAYGVEYEWDGEIQIRIADPASRNYKYLHEYEDDLRPIQWVDYFVPGIGPMNYAKLGCPGEMLVSDSDGRLSGYDPRTGETFNEIPGVSYYAEWPNDDDTDPCSVPSEDRNQASKTAYIQVPDGEVLTFELIGTGDGEGHFALEGVAETGEVKLLMERTLDLEPNSVEIFEIEFPFIENNPPVANAGGDQTVSVDANCVGQVTLDGSDSNDPDEDELSYCWTWLIDSNECDANGVSPTIEMPLGEHTIRLIVNDGIEDSEADEVLVTIQDTTPPEFAMSVTPDLLWPPNHKMVQIVPSWMVSDNCDESVDVTFVSITMNEGDETNTFDTVYDSTLGDGHTAGDIEVDANGDIRLRAERSGTGSGRVYTITYRAVDDSGNVTQDSAAVTVPHDQP